MIAPVTRQELRHPFTTAEGRSILVRSASLADLSHTDYQRWSSLSRRSIDPNPFLAPGFVQALCRRLVDPVSVVVLIVQDAETGDWRSVGVFRETTVRSTSPLMYLESLRTDFSFLDGLLVDQEQTDGLLDALLTALSRQRRWHGLRFRMLHRDSPLAIRLNAATERLGLFHFSRGEFERAEMPLAASTTIDSLLESCSKSRRKKLRRARRVLEGLGEVRFDLRAPRPDETDCVEEFLRLERLGWKGEVGTALAEHADAKAFFREAVRELSKTRDAWFGRLLLNGRAIASTCNFRAGSSLYAFKIGWDPEFDEGLPGFWSELELVCAARQLDPALQRIDSCSVPGSYVESVWPERRSICFASFVWSRRARLMGVVRRQLSCAKRLASVI